MKKNKIIIGSVLIILLCVVFVFSIFQVSESIKKQEQKVQEEKEEIQTNYQKLNNLAANFNEKKEEYNNQYTNLFYEELPEKAPEFERVLEEYTKIVRQIKEVGQNLEIKCQKDYSDNTIERNCTSAKISAKNAQEVYENDVEKYNKLIINYNSWTKSNTTYPKLSLFNKEKEETNE